MSSISTSQVSSITNAHVFGVRSSSNKSLRAQILRRQISGGAERETKPPQMLFYCCLLNDDIEIDALFPVNIKGCVYKY